jgi:hypothetical protein
MSMEIYVLSSRRLALVDEWQKSLDQLSFQLKILWDDSLERMDGFVPVLSLGKKSGFECNHWKIHDLHELLEAGEMLPSDQFVLAFRWGGDLTECLAAVQASAAYATAVDGRVFDPQEGKIVSAPEAVKIARDSEISLPAAQAAFDKALRGFDPNRK